MYVQNSPLFKALSVLDNTRAKTAQRFSQTVFIAITSIKYETDDGYCTPGSFNV